MRFPPVRRRTATGCSTRWRWLLVDLHRGGVYWGDCSLANTLFRRDGDRIQAYLVDAETSEVHPSLSDGQRAFDLDILVENVAFGLADLAALPGPRRRTSTTRSTRPRRSARGTRRSGRAARSSRSSSRGDRQAIRAPAPPAQRPRLRGGRDRGRPRRAGGSRAAADVASTTRALPRPRARAADGARARSRARRGSCSTTCASTTPGWSCYERRAVPREEARRALAARGLSSRPSARIAGARRPGPRPRPGVLRRARAQVAALRARRAATSACEAAIESYLAESGAGAAAPATALDSLDVRGRRPRTGPAAARAGG